MNLQQSVQHKPSANGFGRRRSDKEGGMRLENKMQSGKSNQTWSSSTGAGGKGGFYECPSRDRLVYLTTCLIGHPVEVQLKNGCVYAGTCYTANIEKEFAIILKMARMVKDVTSRAQKAESVSKAPSKTLIIPGKDVVQVVAKDVTVTIDGMSNEAQHQKQHDLMIDSYISQSRHVEAGRELSPWVPEEDDPQCPELENIFDDPWNRGWNQFEANEALFGVKSTFDEEIYTTKLERGPRMREIEREALRIAREIEGEETKDLHLAEERGMQLHESLDVDEETRYSAVCRAKGDDSGYDELEDIMSDLRNGETFASASSTKKSADVAYGNSSEGARGLSNTSLDEATCSQSSTGTGLCYSGSYDHARHLGVDLPFKSCASESEFRISNSLQSENDGNNGGKEPAEEKVMSQTRVANNVQLPKLDSQSSPNDKLDVSDKLPLSASAINYSPSSHVSTKTQEKTSSHSNIAGGAKPTPSIRSVAETQPIISHSGRPGSSASSNSDRFRAASASGPGLSLSSSMGSLTSEKSTLNPHAKEFKLNPNAKSFTPFQVPVRPVSPVSDGSFYYPANVPTLPNMHGMPVGVGIGPSFPGHQPVMFNPQVAPMQSPQAYFHPGGPQYGQQMILGHPRQLLYMPTSYQPEMPPQYKGREF